MAHVRVQRLGAGHCQHDRAERDERHRTMIEEELHAVARGQALQRLWMRGDLAGADERQNTEPQRHDGAEQIAHELGAEALDGE